MVESASPMAIMLVQWPHTAVILDSFFKETPHGLVQLVEVGPGLSQPALHSVRYKYL